MQTKAGRVNDAERRDSIKITVSAADAVLIFLPEVNMMADTAPATRTIWNIADDFTEFESLIESIDGDITEEQAEQLAKFYESLDEELDKKLNNYGRFYRNLTAAGNACIEESDRLKALGESKLKKAEFLTERLKRVFKFKDWKEKSTTFFTFVRKGSGGSAPVQIAKEYEEKPELLPRQFQTKTPELVKAKIQEIREGTDERAKKYLALFERMGLISYKIGISKDAMKTVLASKDDEAKKQLEGIAWFGEKKEKLEIK